MTSTKNLILKPLTYKQLVKYIQNDGTLERDLKLNLTHNLLSNEVRTALTETVLSNLEDEGKNHLFSTLWIIILKAESRIIGEISFVGKPDNSGEVEIGYSTYENYRGKGYMTEAVACILAWAKRQDRVKSIFAQTAVSNKASWRILEKNGFQNVGDVEDLFYWSLNL